MRKMNVNESREIEQLIIDHIFENENDEFIDSFEIQSINCDYVIVRHELNNEYQYVSYYVENIKRLTNA